MAYFQKNEHLSQESCTNIYAGIDQFALAARVDALMTDRGYRLIKGDPGNGTYEKGNRLARILLGAFIKYFKFQIGVAPAADNTVKLTLSRQTSGMSGGLIGMNQVKNEMKWVVDALQQI